jgi:hypothetical protein
VVFVVGDASFALSVALFKLFDSFDLILFRFCDCVPLSAKKTSPYRDYNFTRVEKQNESVTSFQLTKIEERCS